MEAVTGVLGNLMDALGTVTTTVTANAILCIGLAATVGGIGISWFKRLTGQRSGKKR